MTTVIWEVMKEVRWEAAHRLIDGYEGKCNSMHGHSWVARIYVGGPSSPRFNASPSALDEYGMLIDFNAFKPLRAWIDAELDHATILNSNDELVDLFSTVDGCKVFTMEGNPTSENIARLLMQKAYRYLPELLPCVVTRVEVLETCTSMAIYHGG